MSWTASSPSGFMHHYLLWAVTLSLSFPLSRHDARSPHLNAHHHSRALSFSLSRTMATVEALMAGAGSVGGGGSTGRQVATLAASRQPPGSMISRRDAMVLDRGSVDSSTVGSGGGSGDAGCA
jgi:hypothetical protein